MTRIPLRPAMVAMVVVGATVAAAAQSFEIGVIDFYGLNKVSPADARSALTFKEGDTIPPGERERQALRKASEERLTKLPGVVSARIDLTCCEAGRVIVYVGITEDGAPTPSFRPAPQGTVRLPADMVQAGEAFSEAGMSAMERGDNEDDWSQGHSLMHDPATRAIQQRFIGFARRDLPLLREVLRSSGDADHRALAATVLGYAADKQGVVDDLVQAMGDPADEVRNNAMRALLVFAAAEPGSDGSTLDVPAGPFVALLNSPIQSDLNKASMALMVLSEERDEELLAVIRQTALTSLVEMARWKVAGHAMPAFMILARIAGYPDGDAIEMWEGGRREAVIEAALRQR